MGCFVEPGGIVGGGPESWMAVHSMKKPFPPMTESDWNCRVTVLPELLTGGGNLNPQNVPIG